MPDMFRLVIVVGKVLEDVFENHDTKFWWKIVNGCRHALEILCRSVSVDNLDIAQILPVSSA